MLMYLDIKIPHLQIAQWGVNLEVGNIKIHHVAQYLKLPACQIEKFNFSRLPSSNLSKLSNFVQLSILPGYPVPARLSKCQIAKLN